MHLDLLSGDTITWERSVSLLTASLLAATSFSSLFYALYCLTVPGTLLALRRHLMNLAQHK